MLSSEEDIKIKMLNEFESQIEDIFYRYNDNKINLDDLKTFLGNLKIVWNCSRLDMKNLADESSYIKILSHLDNVNLTYPGWFKDNNGQGCKIEGLDEIKGLKIQCSTDGKLIFDLRGLDFRNIENERIPVYINCTKFVINDQIIFDKNMFLWHDKPFTYSKESKKDEIYTISIEYKTIFDYFNHLRTYFIDMGDIEELNEEYNDLMDYIKSEKNLLEKGIYKSESNSVDQDTLLILKNNLDLIIKQHDKEITNLKNELTKYKETNYEFMNTLFLYCDVKSKGLLKYNHLLNIELLDFVVKLCDKYGLEYWLDFGLLLGAVRHNGFIPWDDDLDIGMMRKDYDKLLEVIEDEINVNGLSNEIKISLNMHKYKPLPILQLLYYCEEVDDSIIAGIDIFPYDYIEDISNCDESSYKMIQQGVIEKNLQGIPIEEALYDYFNKFDLHKDEKQYIIPGVEGARGIFFGYDFKIFKTEDIFPLKKIEFEHTQYKVPKNYHEYLSQTYNNYLNIPKTIHHHQDRYEKLRIREDSKEIFDKNIEKLRKINEE